MRRETASVQSLTIGGALGVGVGGGGAGVGVGLAGAGSGNTIKNNVEAYADLGASLTTVGSGDITLSADDTPVIVANAGGVGIGVGVSGDGVGAGASLGVAAAVNDVEDKVYADIVGASATAAGSLALSTNTGGGISFTSPPGLNTGDAVVFHVGATGNVAPGGLTNGTTYYVVKINDNEVALAATLADALAGTTIPLTSVGSGTGMSLTSGTTAHLFDASDVATGGSVEAPHDRWGRGRWRQRRHRCRGRRGRRWFGQYREEHSRVLHPGCEFRG